MYRLALVVLLLSPASAAIAGEIYTKQMLREDISSPGGVITFDQSKTKNPAPDPRPVKPLTYGGVVFKRVSPCAGRRGLYGNRCYFPDSVQLPSKAFYDNIPNISSLDR